MCIDFNDLNKAYKKDSFPLPRIEASIDKAVGCKRFSLLDCFSGYHQIWLKKEDEEKQALPLLLEPIVTRECQRG
jgi:hypothetical protein